MAPKPIKHRILFLSILLLLSFSTFMACDSGTSPGCSGCDGHCEDVDQDGDGYTPAQGDCDDASDLVFPGAEERCNGIDDNCDGVIDDGVQVTYYLDSDGDGFGDMDQTVLSCAAPSGYVADNTDCNDSDGEINPAAEEQCNGVDDNCNCAIDEGCSWNKTIGGEGNDVSNSVIPANDSGYLIAGSSNSYGAGDTDAYIVKIDDHGTELWHKTFGGTEYDSAYKVIPGNTGGYLISGSTKSYGAGEGDVWIIKVDENGDEQWNQTIGGNYEDRVAAVIPGNTGGYVISGTSSNGAEGRDAWIIKFGEDGNELWRKSISGNGSASSAKVIPGNTGGYVVTGYTASSDAEGGDVWVFKMDEDGNELWDKTLGSTIYGYSDFIIPGNNGGYLIVGTTSSNGSKGADTWIVKIDEDGTELWNNTVGTSKDDWASSVIAGNNNEYVIVGTSQSDESEYFDHDAWLIKIDEDGDVTLNQNLGGEEFDITAYSVVQGNDGGYVITGFVYANPDGDINAWIIKIDENGAELWAQTYGDNNFFDLTHSFAQSIIPGNNGEYLIIGTTDNGERNRDVLLIKADENGDISNFDKTADGCLWNKVIGSPYSDSSSSIIQANGGGYLIAGHTQSFYIDHTQNDALITKIDENGNELWRRKYGGTEQDVARSVIRGNNGGYVIAGETWSFDAEINYDTWVIKIDENGNELWSRTYGGNDAYSVIPGNDGGYLVAGTTAPIGAGESDAWIIRIDENGEALWEKTFGGEGVDSAYSVIAGNTGGYVIAGDTTSYGEGNSEPWLIKIDENGNEVWSQTFGSTSFDSARSVIQGNDGGYVVTGNAWIFKIDEDGNEIWNQVIGSFNSNRAYSIISGNNDGYVIVGTTYNGSSTNWDEDAWIIKIDEVGDVLLKEVVSDAESDVSAYAIVQGNAGGYVIAGDINIDSVLDIWLIKIDEDGNGPSMP